MTESRRILLVEDDPGFQLLIQRILERMDPPCRVDTVEGGAAISRQMASTPYDLILLDYSLPGRNGLEVLRDLRDAGAVVPVVMVTGMGSETVAVDALKLGAYDYLVKSGDLRTSLPLVVRRVIEKVRLEDGLRRSSEENERLRELDRLKSQLLANVSHELRTPLVSVAGYAEILLSGQLGPLQEDQRKALVVCSRNAERLRVLIDNILSLSSLESHKVRPIKRAFDLGDLVEDRMAALRPQGEARRMALSLERVGGELSVHADPDLIEQVLWNVMGNALKFTPDEGRIQVSVSRCGERVGVDVTDSGCGIAPEHLLRIFDRFWQVDTSPTRRYPGLGIGLAIAKEILDAHETAMAVTSHPGEGATFHFDLPAAEAPVGRPSAGRMSAHRPSPPRALTVLVVDDEADTREFVKTALEMAGHRVILAAGGRDALNVLRTAPVDIVLLDIAMPDMTGLEVLREMRGGTAPDVPVLLLTAIAEHDLRQQALDEGAAGLVEKPLRTSQLISSLESAARVRA